LQNYFAEYDVMTLDKSLKIKRGSSSARGVLTRAERITRLKEEERWTNGQSPLGLPKVRVIKISMKKKKKKKEEEGDAGAKGATPAKGAKAAAPAGKAAKAAAPAKK
jgi:small basic protein (TIGR04137 family)